MKFAKLLSSMVILSIPISLTISCNESIDSKLKKILSNSDILDVEININAIKAKTGKDVIEIKDIIAQNVDEVVNIVYSQNLINWNNSLSEDNKSIYEIKPNIIGFVLPQMTSDGIINELEVIIDISTGPIANKTITKKISLSNPNINNKIVLNENNVFEQSSNTEIRANILWTSFKKNVLLYLRNQGINSSLSNDSLTDKLKFKFPSTNDSSTNYIAYQSNLCSAFDEKDDNGVYIYLYTNNEQIATKEEIIQKCITIKMFFSFNDLRGN